MDKNILQLDLSTILLFLIAGLLLYTYLTWPYNYFKKLGVPGPTPIPVLGIFKDLGSKGLIDIDEDLVKKYGKVVGTFEMSKAALLISDPELIKQVLVKDFQCFTDRPPIPWRGVFKHSVFDKNGEDWKRIRSLSTPFFSSGKLRQNTKRISSVLNGVIDYLQQQCQDKAEIEGKRFASGFTMDVICNVVFGVDANTLKNQDHQIAVCSKRIMSDFAPSNPWFMFIIFFPELATLIEKFIDVTIFDRKSVTYLSEMCTTLIKQKAEGNKVAEEFVTALVKAHEEELDYESKKALGITQTTKHKGMNEDEIIAQSLFFILAGYDTTATTLGFLLHCLTLNPEVQEKLYQEIKDNVGNEKPDYHNVQKVDYLDWCIDETLRMYPPVPRTNRIVTVDEVKVGGIPLKKGMSVSIPIWYMLHQPDIWPDPYKFDPMRFSPEVKKDRDPYYFLPFGLGPRQCIGLRLAQLEIKMSAITILQRFRLIRNAKTVPVTIDKSAVFTTAKDGLWFTLEERL